MDTVMTPRPRDGGETDPDEFFPSPDAEESPLVPSATSRVLLFDANADESDDEVVYLGTVHPGGSATRPQCPQRTQSTQPSPSMPSPTSCVIQPSNSPQKPIRSPASEPQDQDPVPPVVVDRSSKEWRASLAKYLHAPGHMTICTLCGAADNIGAHQHLNGVMLCPSCLQDAVSVIMEKYNAATHAP